MVILYILIFISNSNRCAATPELDPNQKFLPAEENGSQHIWRQLKSKEKFWKISVNESLYSHNLHNTFWYKSSSSVEIKIIAFLE